MHVVCGYLKGHSDTEYIIRYFYIQYIHTVVLHTVYIIRYFSIAK